MVFVFLSDGFMYFVFLDLIEKLYIYIYRECIYIFIR